MLRLRETPALLVTLYQTLGKYGQIPRFRYLTFTIAIIFCSLRDYHLWNSHRSAVLFRSTTSFQRDHFVSESKLEAGTEIFLFTSESAISAE